MQALPRPLAMWGQRHSSRHLMAIWGRRHNSRLLTLAGGGASRRWMRTRRACQTAAAAAVRAVRQPSRPSARRPTEGQLMQKQQQQQQVMRAVQSSFRAARQDGSSLAAVSSSLERRLTERPMVTSPLSCTRPLVVSRSRCDSASASARSGRHRRCLRRRRMQSCKTFERVHTQALPDVKRLCALADLKIVNADGNQ